MEREQRQLNERDRRVHAIAQYWDEQAGTYDEEFDHAVGSPAEQRAWNRVLSLVTGDRSLAVLDIGTGTGFLALELAAQDHDVIGIDLSPEMLAKARRKSAGRGLRAVFELGDAERPPYPDSTFDLVISRHVFWSLNDQAATLAKWFRLLRPGGTLAILDGDWCAGDPDESESLAADDVSELARSKGFVDVQIDDLSDLSDALDTRAARRGHSVTRFARFLVWGKRPA